MLIDDCAPALQTGTVADRPSKCIRILLVDDHEAVRQGVKLLLDREPDLEVVSEAGDGAEALKSELDHIDVVVMDLSMPGISGLVAVRRLKARRPALAIVSFTRHADKTFLHELLRAGTSGYVLKQSPQAELFRAIRAAARGHQYIDPALTHHLAASFTMRERQPGRPAVPTPTERECEVLRLVAQGFSNKEIAAQLGVSAKTIEAHKANGMHKLGLRGRIELTQYALHQGWLHEV
jgi:DNA-binding NarL/FixJ family response regulator